MSFVSFEFASTHFGSSAALSACSLFVSSLELELFSTSASDILVNRTVSTELVARSEGTKTESHCNLFGFPSLFQGWE